MPEFIKDLVELRKSQDISLEDIYERTKISISSLQSIEKGNFNDLPITYVRLFLKAYVTEIGGDSVKALNDLDVYLSPKEKIKILDISSDENSRESFLTKKLINYSKNKPPKKIRTDSIKSIILVCIFIFTIYVIKSVASDRNAAKPPIYKSEFEEEGPVSLNLLEKEFNKESIYERKLEISNPYNLRIASDQRIWFSYKIDDEKKNENVLPSGDNRLFPFNNSIELILKHSLGLTLNLNKIDLAIPQSITNPLMIKFDSIDNILIVNTFSPKN